VSSRLSESNRRPCHYEATPRPPHESTENTTVLPSDLAPAIRNLKATASGELQVHGSGNLIRWLLEHDLVDELTLLVVPVILGLGIRLFPDAGPDISLELVSSQADSKGVAIQVYRPVGRPQYPPNDV
jgi:dihydrofolate reductase